MLENYSAALRLVLLVHVYGFIKPLRKGDEQVVNVSFFFLYVNVMYEFISLDFLPLTSCLFTMLSFMMNSLDFFASNFHVPNGILRYILDMYPGWVLFLDE